MQEEEKLSQRFNIKHTHIKMQQQKLKSSKKMLNGNENDLKFV
jgi:hypothetical protein